MASEIIAGMLAQGAGSLLGAGASLWAQHREQNWSAEQAAIDRGFQSEEADKARLWNEAMWNKQNEYNTPLAQYQRLRELGINDASIMGMMSGNGAAGNASSVATQSAPGGAQAAGQGSIAAGLGQYIADIPKAGVELASSSEDVYNKRIQNEIAEETKMDMIRLAHLNVSEAGKRIENLVAQSRSVEQQTRLMRLQTEAQDLNNQQYKRMMDLEVKLAKADYELKVAQIGREEAATSLSLAQQGKIPFDVALVIAQTAYQNEAKEHLGDKTLEQYLVGTLGPIIEKWLGLTHGDGDDNGAGNKVVEWLKEGLNKVSNTTEAVGDLGIGLHPLEGDKQFRKEMRELSMQYLRGEVSWEEYNKKQQKIYESKWERERKKK